jgi:Mg2+/Co2+ transporter CorB
MPDDVRRRILREAVAVVATIVVGAVLIAIQAATAATAVGIVLVGGGLVAAVAIVFAEIGFSEDRDRQASERRPEPHSGDEPRRPAPDWRPPRRP